MLEGTPATGRPADPTIAQLREVTQPPSVRTRAGAEHWVASAYLRDVSPYLTRILLKAGFSANGVTWLMIALHGAGRVLHGLVDAGGRDPDRGASSSCRC